MSKLSPAEQPQEELDEAGQSVLVGCNCEKDPMWCDIPKHYWNAASEVEQALEDSIN